MSNNSTFTATNHHLGHQSASPPPQTITSPSITTFTITNHYFDHTKRHVYRSDHHFHYER
jgi:hypothetical protein